MNPLPKTIKIEKDILVQELDNTIVILNLTTEQYYGLDEVGQRIWELLVDHQDTKVVWSMLIQEYDVDPVLLEEDMNQLIKELSEAKLITVS